jgi:hypothetical protein
MRSAAKTQKVSLSTVATVYRVNHFDPCCNGGLLNEEKGLILFQETPIYGRI